MCILNGKYNVVVQTPMLLAECPSKLKQRLSFTFGMVGTGRLPSCRRDVLTGTRKWFLNLKINCKLQRNSIESWMMAL